MTICDISESLKDISCNDNDYENSILNIYFLFKFKVQIKVHADNIWGLSINTSAKLFIFNFFSQ